MDEVFCAHFMLFACVFLESQLSWWVGRVKDSHAQTRTRSCSDAKLRDSVAVFSKDSEPPVTLFQKSDFGQIS